jgi:CRISPR/Cas system-associated exonuclease Cas4 (RecB family)
MKIEGHPKAAPRQKAWAWSYSKLKNFEVCPKKHYEVDLAKTYAEEEKPDGPLAWGNRVHDALAKALKGEAELPAEMQHYAAWVDRVKSGAGKLYVEQKYAINRQFQKTAYFADDVWYRGVGDVVRVDGDLALVLDWKTGKILEDSVQLMLMAQCLFSHYPELKYVRSEFVWLKDDCSTPELFTRKEVGDQWIGLLDRVNALEHAAKTMTYPPKPGRLCRSYCPVESCPFHKKGA